MSLRLAYQVKMGKIYRSVFVAVAALSLFSYTASASSPAEFLKKVPISLSTSAQTALGQETLSGFPVLVRLSTAISGFSYADIAADHGHMTFAQAATVAARANARRLWLAHYSQMVEDPSACLPTAAAIFPDAVCGEDGMKITLRFND